MWPKCAGPPAAAIEFVQNPHTGKRFDADRALGGTGCRLFSRRALSYVRYPWNILGFRAAIDHHA